MGASSEDAWKSLKSRCCAESRPVAQMPRISGSCGCDGCGFEGQGCEVCRCEGCGGDGDDPLMGGRKSPIGVAPSKNFSLAINLMSVRSFGAISARQ
jgi:hypothetical protein